MKGSQIRGADANATLARRVERLEAAEAIRQGLCRYARAVDRNDLPLLNGSIHPNALGRSRSDDDVVSVGRFRLGLHRVLLPLPVLQA